MGTWQYKREEKAAFAKIPAGDHRVRIEDAEMTTSKAGNDMIKLTIAVSGMNRTLWDYIVFMDDKPEITNGKFTAIYDAFNMEEGESDLSKWIGAVGAARTKIDENEFEKVAYYIAKRRAGNLPAWVEPTGGAAKRIRDDAPQGGYQLPADDDDMPF